ncbi:glutathione S-transferase T1 isoform X1 [Nicotiana tabacum]|uniref:Glutathione S-transferase T1 isoform X1 n=2 Tax=Nicotiana tabacum TaxID=4097 RepID=A0AC58U6D4_TOBAC
MDGRFKLFESHAILRYLACAFPGVADHWYQLTYTKEQRSTLCWIGITLTCVVVQVLIPEIEIILLPVAVYVFSTVLAPAFGLPLNQQAAAEAEKVLLASLAKIESVWLQKKGRFLLGSGQPSIADLSLVCEIMQLEVLDEKDHKRIIGPYKRVLKWIDDTKNAMEPHFGEVHLILFKAKEKFQKQRDAVGSSIPQSSRKLDLHSKM